MRGRLEEQHGSSEVILVILLSHHRALLGYELPNFHFEATNENRLNDIDKVSAAVPPADPLVHVAGTYLSLLHHE